LNKNWKIEIIEAWEDLHSLKREWNGLLRRSRADTIFLTKEWADVWTEVSPSNIRPFVIIVRSVDGRLVGIAPFYRGNFRLLKVFPLHSLRIVGDYASGAEYPDWIVDQEMEKEVYQVIAEALKVSKDRWDIIWMPNISGWSGALERLMTGSRKAGLTSRVRTMAFAYLDLSGNINDYLKSFSKNMKQQVDRQIKKILKREGVEVVRCEKEEDLPEFLEALFDLHSKRWQEKGQMGTFKKKPSELKFYNEFARRAINNGWLWLMGLRDKGEFKAMQIGYVYNNVFHQLQEGFDPEYLPGVGNVLRIKVMEALMQQGITGYDFLGEMTEHKRKWSAQARAGYDLLIGHGNLKDRFISRFDIWPTGRFLKPS
jgi:CelD/BcsL family acetyltransferase involved in cellulose biosynthesis